MSSHTPPPWKIYDDSDPLHIAIKGFRSDIGGAHVADVLSHDNAAFLLKAVNNYDAMIEALERCKGSLEVCAEMHPDNRGIARALSAARATLVAVSTTGEPK
jgi:hypothetical protein